MHIMDNITYPQRKRTPSFSSTLLDAIYRSIDESKSNLDNETINHKTTLKHISVSHNHHHNHKEPQRIMNFRRNSVMLDDDWIEKQSTHTSSQFMNSSSVTSTSSESSYGGGTLFFSSSETEHTTHKTRPRSSKQHEMRHVFEKNHHHQHHQKNPKHERGTSFERTKLRALKIYGELNQKVRHPISPGSRIASFLSSIFSSGNVKKAKMCYVGAVEDVTLEHKSKSPCFSNSSTTSSSFSRRSCMSKTPKNNNNNNNGVKRSVRFYPVSVILGEDSHQLPSSCHRYSNYEKNDSSLLPLHSSTVRKVSRSSNSIEEFKKNCVMAKENIGIGVNMKGYHNNNNCNKGNGKFGFRGFYERVNNDDEDEDDEEDDALSYSSSDLFELDHIIGAARYQEELPVYETTDVETNMAIANGICL